MIQVKSLYKSFEGKDVLVDINATFNNGKTNLIIGQSGSGKTVLMKCIVGLLTPEKGEILYDGRNFLNMNKKEKKFVSEKCRSGNRGFDRNFFRFIIVQRHVDLFCHVRSMAGCVHRFHYRTSLTALSVSASLLGEIPAAQKFADFFGNNLFKR